MKTRRWMFMVPLLVAVPGFAAPMDHQMMMDKNTTPENGRDPHGYSDGYTLDSGPYALPGPRQLRLADEKRFFHLLVNKLEWQHSQAENVTAYDTQAWFGNTYDKLAVKAEGEWHKGKLADARTELLWQHAVSAYWNTQLGARLDGGPGPARKWLAFGIQGLSPYWFEVDATAYVGEQGRTAFRLDSDYELLITQRLILQPALSLNWYGKDDVARGIGSGIANTAVGLRLRYEFSRRFAPYIGVQRQHSWGRSADLARQNGEPVAQTQWLAGVRVWF